MSKRHRRAIRWKNKQRRMWYTLRCIWACYVKVGDLVEDCNYHVQAVKEIDSDRDYVTLENGAGCSLRNCCDPVPRPKTLNEMILLVNQLLEAPEKADKIDRLWLQEQSYFELREAKKELRFFRTGLTIQTPG